MKKEVIKTMFRQDKKTKEIVLVFFDESCWVPTEGHSGFSWEYIFKDTIPSKDKEINQYYKELYESLYSIDDDYVFELKEVKKRDFKEIAKFKNSL